MFKAEIVDDLTLEQYNILIELWNLQAEAKIDASMDKRTTRIVTVPGKKGVNYGDD